MKLFPSLILGKKIPKKRFKITKISGSALGLECPVCTLEWDHTGKLIDGEEQCLNMDGDLAEMSQQCTGNGFNPKFTCETRLNSVWDREGEMTFRLRRSCNSYSNTV